MSAYQYKFKLVLESPFLTQGLNIAALGFDTSTLRNTDDRPVISGSLIKGVVRDILSEICDHSQAPLSEAQLDDWFGTKSSTNTASASSDSYAPQRARLVFSDLVASKPAEMGTTTRIQIHPDTGSVREGHLQVIELPYPVGEHIAFYGNIIARGDQTDTDKIIKACQAAIAHAPAIGAFKSAGFGRIICAKIDFSQVRIAGGTTSAQSMPGSASITGFSLVPDRPFLIDASREADNFFRGNTIIPGTAIKGMLAEQLAAEGNLAANSAELSKIRISHAFPVPAADTGTSRPCPLPLSLGIVTAPDGKKFVYDYLHAPVESRSPTELLRHNKAPRFAFDWSTDEIMAAANEFGNAPNNDLSYSVRTRTKINELTGTVAASQLFSYASVVPDGWKWLGDIDMSAIDADTRDIFAKALFDGLPNLGKTKAFANVTPSPASRRSKTPGNEANMIAVTLATDALMNDPADLLAHDDRPHSPQERLRQSYADFWSDVTGNQLRLVNFFARQRLAGGYQARRFVRQGEPYYPFLVTEAGSTFLLEGTANAIVPLLTSGLPLPNALSALDWRSCPFVRENGFAEIRCNHIDHMALFTQGRPLKTRGS